VFQGLGSSESGILGDGMGYEPQGSKRRSWLEVGVGVYITWGCSQGVQCSGCGLASFVVEPLAGSPGFPEALMA
jgi:hypothetical protein